MSILSMFGNGSEWSFRKEKPEWPLDDHGEKEKAVLLKRCFDSPVDNEMLISFLLAYGVPCFAYYDKEGGAGKVINGFSGYGVELYVPESRLQEAQDLLGAQPIEEDE